VTVFCSNCGKPNPAAATQCVACGTPLNPKGGGSKFKGTIMMTGLAPFKPGAPSGPGPAGGSAAPPGATPPNPAGAAAPTTTGGGSAAASQDKDIAYQPTMLGPISPPGSGSAGAGPAASSPPWGSPPTTPSGAPPTSGSGTSTPPASTPAFGSGFGAPGSSVPSATAGSGVASSAVEAPGASPPASGFGTSPSSPAPSSGFGTSPSSPAPSSGFGSAQPVGGDPWHGLGAPRVAGPAPGVESPPPAFSTAYGGGSAAQTKNKMVRYLLIGCAALLLLGCLCAGAWWVLNAALAISTPPPS
jgi:hypothetical protein